jgi:hypothetical protein
MKNCCLCQKPFDPAEKSTEPAVEAGLVLAREQYNDEGDVCINCLDSRGRLAMMYMLETFD